MVILWALLIAGIFKVSQFEKEYAEYNPYNVLEIDPVGMLPLQMYSGTTQFTRSTPFCVTCAIALAQAGTCAEYGTQIIAEL